jgi:hypothetical protein
MGEETRRWKTALGLMLAGLVAWAVLGSAGGGNSKDANRLTESQTTGDHQKTSADPADSCADPAACREANRIAYARAGKPGWVYADGQNPMRGTIRSANIESSDRLEFAFPYAGGSTATLSLRKMNNDLDVMISVDKGQFICYGMGDSEMKAKFDNGKVQDFRCGRAADGSANVIFIKPGSSFLASLRKAKVLIVEATFYQAGARQMTFHVEGLDWK